MCVPICKDEDSKYVNGKCVCNMESEEYDEETKTCVPICKDDSKWVNGECICNKESEEYDE